MSRPAAAFSLQSVTQRFCRLPCLFIADMGIAHGRADILVAEQFLDFPQILSHLVEEDRGRGVAQSMRGDLPYPEGSTGGPQPQIERPVGKRRARNSGLPAKKRTVVANGRRRCEGVTNLNQAEDSSPPLGSSPLSGP